MPPWALRLAWSAPSRAKWRRTVNRASIRSSQELSVGMWTISTSLAAAQVPTRRHRFVVRRGEQLPQTIAIRTSAGCTERR
ncbi:hypothetical protein AMK19_30420 [Kitasatospora sp. CB01950]|nr:hypothetical protein AMK19_30420 [Kitasatospora sp. CB01950]